MRRYSLLFVSLMAFSGHAWASEPKTVVIPLSEIATTSRQEGLGYVTDSLQANHDGDACKSAQHHLREIQDISTGNSDVFLVDAVNLCEAIEESFNILRASRSAETIDMANEPNSCWLVVYLGSGPSNPVWWKIEDVGIQGPLVTLKYRKSKPMPATADVRHYFYWVPLGKLGPDTYELRLFDAEQEKVTLLRRVHLVQTNNRGGVR